MGKYRGPTCKLARREGTDLFLKSPVRSLTQNVSLIANRDLDQEGAARA